MRIASLPRRYRVEGTFSWFGRKRRLGADFANRPETLDAFATLASILLALGRLAGAQIVQRAVQARQRSRARQVVPPRGQAAAALVRMGALCRSPNLYFRIGTSRPRTNA
jgi:hypothetical protein